MTDIDSTSLHLYMPFAPPASSSLLRTHRDTGSIIYFLLLLYTSTIIYIHKRAYPSGHSGQHHIARLLFVVVDEGARSGKWCVVCVSVCSVHGGAGVRTLRPGDGFSSACAPPASGLCVCAKSCFFARTVSRRKSTAECPKFTTMFYCLELLLCFVLMLLTSDVTVAVAPVMLEGSVVHRDISMLSRKTEMGARLSGFTIELAFDQPLVVHAGNTSASLRTVKPLSPIDRAFLELVSMRCNGQAEPIQLGQFSIRGKQFLNLLGNGGGEEIAIANITTSPKHPRARTSRTHRL